MRQWVITFPCSPRLLFAARPDLLTRVPSIVTAIQRFGSNPGLNGKPFTVSRDGFSLNAAAACPAHERDRLERVCSCLLRPPVALERLSVDGLVV